MKAKIFGVISAAAILGAISFPIAANAGRPEVLPTVSAAKDPHVFLTHGAYKSGTSGGSNLMYFGGPVMYNPVVVTPIFWGTKWGSTSYTADKATGLSAFYTQYSQSNYAKISSQYKQANGSSVSNLTSLGTTVTDASVASSTTSSVLAEVVNKIGFAGLSTDGYYPVYTDLPRGNAGFCAWHSVGTVSSGSQSKQIKFAFFFDLAGDAGCDPADPQTTYSQGTEALANVSAHELAETMTDPELNGWKDRQGAENGDKCAWQFSSNPTSFVILSGSTYAWKLQGEWDNSISTCKW